MNRLLVRITTIAVLLLGLIACQAATRSEGHELVGTHYKNYEIGLEFDVPESWKLDLREAMPPDFESLRILVEESGGQLYLGGWREELFGIQLMSESLLPEHEITAEDYANAVQYNAGAPVTLHGRDSFEIAGTPVVRMLHSQPAGTSSFVHLDYIIVHRDRVIRTSFWTVPELGAEIAGVADEIMKTTALF